MFVNRQQYCHRGHRLEWLLAALVSGFVQATPASACELRLEGLDDIHVVFDQAYSSKSDTGPTQSDPFKVAGGEQGCPFFVTFSGDGVRSLEGANGQLLNYGLYDSIQRYNPLRELPAATARHVLSGNLNNRQPARALRYYLFVPFDQLAVAGLYRDTVEISVYEGDLDNFVLRDSRSVVYTVEVPPQVDIRIQGGADNAILDFGTLQTGESRSFAVEVEANIAYDISIESEQKGVLKLRTDRRADAIPYRLLHDGRVVDLTRMAQISAMQKKVKRNIDVHAFAVLIGDFDFVQRGRYQDNLLFTVTAR